MYETFKLTKTEYGTIKAYLWHVPDPKKVVCIIHGLGEYAGRYDRVAQRLQENGVAVVSMDERGHGLTEGPRGHCAPRQKVLDDITVLLQYIEDKYPDKDIVMYGHSMGGNITMDYRSRGERCDLPKAYVISSPWITLVRSIPKPLLAVVKLMAKIKPTLAIHSNVDEEVLGNPEFVLPYNEDPLVDNKISMGCAADCYDIGFALRDGTLKDKGLAWSIPTLLMIGSDDKICDPQGSRDMFARMQKAGEEVGFVEWEGYCHEIHNGGGEFTGDEVIDRIVQFVLDPQV
ncbi:MAG: lysophospholipase [Firmicutes bacterium]|nr:lysophospholipase [Bacillota bacterium]